MTPTQDRGDRPDSKQAAATFTRFYAEHRSMALIVLRVALSGTGVDPDDVAGGMWTKLWEAWRERGPLVEAPKAYVRRCARNAAVDALRTRKELPLDEEGLATLTGRQCAVSDSAPSPRATGPVPSGPGRSTAEELLTDPRLIVAVEKLSPIERLIVLIWVETSPPPTSEQIARDLNLTSASTVRGHRMRALNKLRDIFGSDDGKEGG